MLLFYLDGKGLAFVIILVHEFDRALCFQTRVEADKGDSFGEPCVFAVQDPRRNNLSNSRKEVLYFLQRRGARYSSDVQVRVLK